MGVNSLPMTVTRQRRGCDLNPGPSAPESSTLTTRPTFISVHAASEHYEDTFVGLLCGGRGRLLWPIHRTVQVNGVADWPLVR